MDTTTIDQLAEHRRQSRYHHCRCVHELLDGRDDLRGVHPLADLLDDAVPWSA